MAEESLVLVVSSVVIVLTAIAWILFSQQSTRKGNGKKVVAFYHPYCSSGGGGERVLWAIIKALGELEAEGLPMKIIIYSLDEPSETYKSDVLKKVRDRFAITVSQSMDLEFVHLNDYSHLLERASRLSLIVESWGTMRLAYIALKRSHANPPQIFVDTTGCAFTYIVARILFGCTVIAYVHYPTISIDMLSLVWERRRATYNNSDYIAKNRFITYLKLVYYCIFALAYGTVGSLSSLVLVNSTWTLGHISSLWKLAAWCKRIHVVYPPCRISTEKIETKNCEERERTVLSIGQFRPEKDHELQIEAVALLLDKRPDFKKDVKLAILGSCRGESDEKRLQYLQQLVKEKGLLDNVEFIVNQPYSVVEKWLMKASVGIHTMWNEHFGIGIVEMMAAGLITIAHNSGGPKSDIIDPIGGNRTGFLASSAAQYADALEEAFSLKEQERAAIRNNAVMSCNRFSDSAFNSSFKGSILESGLFTLR